MKTRSMKAFGLIAAITLALALSVPVLSGCATTSSKPMTAKEMVGAANKQVATITTDQAKSDLDKGGYIFLDVRDAKEFRMGHIPGAMNISRGTLEFKVASAIPDKSAKINVYCKTGGRGALATQTLEQMGYQNVQNVAGGWVAWNKAGYPVE